MENTEVKDYEGSMSRTFSPLMAWALALGCTVGWGSFVMPGTIFLPGGGPLGTAIAFAVGTIAMLVVAANCGFMAQLFPEQGGMYRYIQESFGPNHAFVCSWCLVLAYGSAMVSNATAIALVVRGTLGPFMQVGLHYVVAGYDVYLGEALVGVLLVVLASLILLRGTRLAGIVELILAIGMVLGTIGILLQVALSPEVTIEAMQPAFNPQRSPLAGILTVLATVPWAFIGFESVTQLSEESSFSPSKYTGIMVAAILCGTVMYLTYTAAATAITPPGYDSWVAYINNLDNEQGLAAIPTFYAGHTLGGQAGLMMYLITAVCAVLSGVIGFYLVVTRLIHAMASDRALPTQLARIDRRHGTPAFAIVVVLAVTITVPFIGRNVLSWIFDLMSLGALIAYIYISLAVWRLARRDGKPLMRALGALGTAISLVCLALLIIPLPGLSTSLSRESYIVLAAWVALGVNFFTPTIER